LISWFKFSGEGTGEQMSMVFKGGSHTQPFNTHTLVHNKVL